MQAKRRGRKPGAKVYEQGGADRVVFYRRVRPEQVEALEAVLAGSQTSAPVKAIGVIHWAEIVGSKPVADESMLAKLQAEIVALKAELAVKAKETPVAPAGNTSEDVKLLLESNEVLTQEIAELKADLARCSAESEDQKTHWWRKKYNDLYADVVAKHGSAEFSQ